eukprot:scaffold1658_cov115-Isochrysis_galbana.AAC.7
MRVNELATTNLSASVGAQVRQEAPQPGVPSRLAHRHRERDQLPRLELMQPRPDLASEIAEQRLIQHRDRRHRVRQRGQLSRVEGVQLRRRRRRDRLEEMPCWPRPPRQLGLGKGARDRGQLVRSHAPSVSGGVGGELVEQIQHVARRRLVGTECRCGGEGVGQHGEVEGTEALQPAIAHGEPGQLLIQSRLTQLRMRQTPTQPRETRVAQFVDRPYRDVEKTDRLRSQPQPGDCLQQPGQLLQRQPVWRPSRAQDDEAEEVRCVVLGGRVCSGQADHPVKGEPVERRPRHAGVGPPTSRTHRPPARPPAGTQPQRCGVEDGAPGVRRTLWQRGMRSGEM